MLAVAATVALWLTIGDLDREMVVDLLSVEDNVWQIHNRAPKRVTMRLGTAS